MDFRVSRWPCGLRHETYCMSATTVWECADGHDRKTAVAGAVAAMRRGGIVLLPTENCYVVATDAFSTRGTALLRRAKMQPTTTPLGLLVASPTMVSGVAARIPRQARALMDAFWPGLVTLLLRPQPTLAWDHPRGAALAVRMPLHPLTLAVCAALGPMAASAATISGGAAPTTIAAALDSLGDDVAGACDVGTLGERAWSDLEDPELASTVVDVRGREPQIVRAGAVASPRVEAVLATVEPARDKVASLGQGVDPPDEELRES